MERIPEVVQVVPKDNYTVLVYFLDGKIVLYDMKPNLDKDIFKKLKDPVIFSETCTVLNDTLAWDLKGNRDESACIDIDPCSLYELPMYTGAA